MRWGPRFHHCFGVVLALSLTSVGYAQAVDASTRENVVAARSGADVEARRKALLEAMLSDPSNLDLAFEYAALSEQAGDIEAAISTLERMLVFAPGLPRLQFELGVLYYRLNSWNTAKSYFASVLAQPTVPDDIRTRIGLYMATIEEHESGQTSFGIVGTGVRYQSNANAGPNSPFIDLGGIEFELDEGALSTPDWNAYVAGRYSTSIDLQNQGDSFFFDIRGYGSVYAEQKDLNTGVLEMQLGPNFNLASLGLENTHLSVYGDFNTAVLGGDPYIAIAGLGTDLSVLLDVRTRVTLHGFARQEQYFDSDLRPTSSERTGQSYGVASRLEYLLTPDVALYTALELDRKIASVDFYSTWTGSVSAGLAWSFDGPGDGDPWQLNIAGGIDNELSDAPDPAMMTTEPENKTLSYASAGLVVPLGEQLSLNSSLTYSTSNSNYDLSVWDNLSASFGLSRSF